MGLTQGKWGCQKAGGAPKKQMGRQKGRRVAKKADGAPKRQMGHQKGRWGAKKADGVLKGRWGAKRQMRRQKVGGHQKACGRQKACGTSKNMWGANKHVSCQKAYPVLKTLCHWLWMKSKAGADDLVSLAEVQSKAGGDEASRQGW
jgi:hypothetical protein